MKAELTKLFLERLVEETRHNKLLWSAEIAVGGMVTYTSSFSSFDIIMCASGLNPVPDIFMRKGSSLIRIIGKDDSSALNHELRLYSSQLLGMTKLGMARKEDWDSMILDYLK